MSNDQQQQHPYGQQAVQEAQDLAAQARQIGAELEDKADARWGHRAVVWAFIAGAIVAVFWLITGHFPLLGAAR